MDRRMLIMMKNGDTEAFRAVILESQRTLYSFILKYTADEEAAHDILQETYIRIWNSRRRYDPDRNFMTWALSIAANRCRDYWRWRRRKPVTDSDERMLSAVMSDADTCTELSNREWASIVRVLASGMGGKQRLVFSLSCLEGFSHGEIEEITGLNASQVKSNLYAAKLIVKRKLKEMGYE